MKSKEFIPIALAVALCVALSFFLLVWLFQHLDPSLGGFIK